MPAAGLTVGKHAAPDGASAHPLVAAALASRGDGSGTHREGDERPGTESEVGWPVPPAPEGGGLGWPADAGEEQSEAAAEPVTRPVLRRGWRRVFGLGRVA
jgi:hypothetical protein